MPRTVAEVRRIKRLHDSGDHDRCDINVCPAAAAAMEELEPESDEVVARAALLNDKALLNELIRQHLDPNDYIPAERQAEIASFDGEPDLVNTLQARVIIKLWPI